jgi:hypothetical protein
LILREAANQRDFVQSSLTPLIQAPEPIVPDASKAMVPYNTEGFMGHPVIVEKSHDSRQKTLRKRSYKRSAISQHHRPGLVLELMRCNIHFDGRRKNENDGDD